MLVNKRCITCKYLPITEIKKCILCAEDDQWEPKVVDKLDTALAAPLRECEGVTREGDIGTVEEVLDNLDMGFPVDALRYFPLQENRLCPKHK